MALPKFGLNEGSLLRRTLLHVATFVLGSVAFVSIVSLVLVSVARGIVPHAGDQGASGGDEDGETSAKPGSAGMKSGIPGMRTSINKKKALPTAAERPKDE